MEQCFSAYQWNPIKSTMPEREMRANANFQLGDEQLNSNQHELSAIEYAGCLWAEIPVETLGRCHCGHGAGRNTRTVSNIHPIQDVLRVK